MMILSANEASTRTTSPPSEVAFTPVMRTIAQSTKRHAQTGRRQYVPFLPLICSANWTAACWAVVDLSKVIAVISCSVSHPSRLHHSYTPSHHHPPRCLDAETFGSGSVIPINTAEIADKR